MFFVLCWIELSIFHISQDIRVSVILTTFFGHISGSTGPILLTSKTILSATKFPIMLVSIIFSVYVIFLEIFSKQKRTSHKIPSSAQVRYYFDHNSGTTEPILMNLNKYAQSDSLQQCLLSFFLYLSYFSRFSQKTFQTPQFDHFLTTFFAHISGSNEPILLILELSLSLA